MQERWHGDRRDLVKWSCLLDLAIKNRLRRIVYVACLREDTTELDTLAQFDAAVVRAVWHHFRDLSSLSTLTGQFGVDCHTVDRVYPASGDARRRYWEAISKDISDGPRPSLVFLDPDTGLGSPRSGAHVSVDEVQRVWGLLEDGEHLVLYQHAWRVQNWREEATQRFADALDVPTASVRVVHSRVSNDVIFLVVARGEASE